MKSGLALAGAAAAALLTTQPVMASETLSSESLPAAGVAVKSAPSMADSSRVGVTRKGSRVGDAEGNVLAFLGTPFGLISGFVFTGIVLDGLNIIDLEIINFGFLGIHGPYQAVA